jgi:hypothetical protein
VRSGSIERLTPTSYLVLGLLAREGPSTPYDLEQRVKLFGSSEISNREVGAKGPPSRGAAQADVHAGIVQAAKEGRILTSTSKIIVKISFLFYA